MNAECIARGARQRALPTIVGGLIFSQMLTLYTTPVVYLYLDRFRIWFGRVPGEHRHRTKKVVPDTIA